MMFQTGDGERSGIRFAIEQERFTPAKVRYSRTINRFRETPAGTTAILDQLLFSVMFPNVLQVGSTSLDFSALAHGVNMIIQHSHVSPCEKIWDLFSPCLDFRPPSERYCVSSACERAGRKIGMSTP